MGRVISFPKLYFVPFALHFVYNLDALINALRYQVNLFGDKNVGVGRNGLLEW